MTTLIAFLVTLGVLIVVHEYGHYLAARRCGVKVLQFSVGFGRPLYTRRFGQDQTEFVLAAFPLGGYVRMLDEREAPVAAHELDRAFNRQSLAKRMVIVLAGPVSNLLLAILLYWGLFMAGLPGLRPVVGEVPPASPAAAASLKTEEVIVRVGGTPVRTWDEVRWALLQATLSDRPVQIEARSGDRETHLHQLDVSGIRHEEAKVDPLTQLGLNVFRPRWPARVGEVLPGSPADQAGLRAGDVILEIDGNAVAAWEEFAASMRQNPGKTLAVRVQRDRAELTLHLTPQPVGTGESLRGRAGAAYVMTAAEMERLFVEVQYGPLPALWQGVRKTWDTSWFSLRMLGGMLTGSVSWRSIGGPVTIGDAAGKSATAGWKAFASFLALVSISLGVLNLLPVPVLDGGHLMYYMVEFVRGRPVSERAMEIGQKAGILLLSLLMAIAFFNDINRLITG